MSELIYLYSGLNDGKARNELNHGAGCAGIDLNKMHSHSEINKIREIRKRKKVRSGHEYHSLTDIANDYSPIEK